MHAYLGVVTYALLVVQALVGATAFFTPGLYGGVGKAKSLYKWHRMSGYLLLVVMFVTVGCKYQFLLLSDLRLVIWELGVRS